MAHEDSITAHQPGQKTKIHLPDYINPPVVLGGTVPVPVGKKANPRNTDPDDEGYTSDVLDDGIHLGPTKADDEPPVKRRKLRRPGEGGTKLPAVGTKNRLAEVPERSMYDEYIGRSFHGMSYVHVFDYCRASKTNVLIEGPTGSGKTHAVMAYAALRNLPFYSVSSSVGIEPTQLFGKFIPAEDGSGFTWQDGPVTDLIRHGGVLLLNEVNFIPERISTVLFSALDSRRVIQLVDHKGEVIVGHPNLLIVADMNPAYEGTRPLNRAFRNRFGVQLEWDYDATVEAELVSNDSLRFFAGKVRDDSSSSGSVTPCSTNMLIEFDKFVRATGNLNFAVANFMNHFESRDRTVIDVLMKTYIENIRADYQKAGVATSWS